jgi:hypothetical protein
LKVVRSDEGRPASCRKGEAGLLPGHSLLEHEDNPHLCGETHTSEVISRSTKSRIVVSGYSNLW